MTAMESYHSNELINATIFPQKINLLFFLVPLITRSLRSYLPNECDILAQFEETNKENSSESSEERSLSRVICPRYVLFIKNITNLIIYYRK